MLKDNELARHTSTKLPQLCLVEVLPTSTEQAFTLTPNLELGFGTSGALAMTLSPMPNQRLGENSSSSTHSCLRNHKTI
jgi:hypothetical protein